MDKLIRNSTAEFLIFTSQSGKESIGVKVFDESVWLTQKYTKVKLSISSFSAPYSVFNG
ncbi:MAG: hypothetical protein LGB05_06705 [Sulfurovum sp.]|nr:hypothetical protein [Sulfurovum sp.]MCB4773295.1 hypothetical protein [Sulfurovum sp.]MCB4782067.1 hypothetical protein [Sulfurovum sp.]